MSRKYSTYKRKTKKKNYSTPVEERILNQLLKVLLWPVKKAHYVCTKHLWRPLRLFVWIERFTSLRRQRKCIPFRELMKHGYVSGATGSGKSQLLRQLFYRLVLDSRPRKHSFVLIDPHGDLSQEIKQTKMFPDPKRFIYVDAGLRKWYSSIINPLEVPNTRPEFIVTHAQNLSKAIQEAVGADLTVNMGTLLVPCLTLLMSRKWSTFLDLIKLLHDDETLIEAGKQLPSHAHRMVFEKFTDKYYSRTKKSIATKLQSFLNYPAFYHAVVGTSTINISKAINTGKVVVFNLSQRYFGPDASQAYGRFIISMIKSSVSMRGKFRRPTFLFVDECQNFISSSMSDILEQSRKYGLHLIMANQSVDRLGSIEKVVLANTSVKIIGKNDSINTAKKMSAITGEDVTVFTRLRNYRFYIRSGYRKNLFKASDFLINDKSMLLNPQAEKELNKYLVDTYYTKIQDTKTHQWNTNNDHSPLFTL